MEFLYSKMAGDAEIWLNDISHLKARRLKIGDQINIRNFGVCVNFVYEIAEISRKSYKICLIKHDSIAQYSLNLTLAWGIIEPKIIEKTLPFLNEIGVKKLIFVRCDFSQRNFHINFQRCENILIESSQQCGRNSLLEMEIYENLSDFLSTYKNVARVDFTAQNGDAKTLNLYNDEILFIGPEGGFSSNERTKIPNFFTLNTKFILRSQSAIKAVASKILL